MAGVMNKTARQFNLKCMGKNGHKVSVRIAPGFNSVDDQHWEYFIKPKVDPYVAELKAQNLIDFGDEMDDLELERDPDTKSKSKSTPPPLDNEELDAKKSKSKSKSKK